MKAYKLSITSGKAARDSSFEQKIDELLKTGKFAEKGEDYWRRQLEYAEEEDVRGLKRSHPIEGERYQHEWEVSTKSVKFTLHFCSFLIPFETFAAAVSEKRTGLADFADFSPNLKFF